MPDNHERARHPRTNRNSEAMSEAKAMAAYRRVIKAMDARTAQAIRLYRRAVRNRQTHTTGEFLEGV